MAQRQFKSTDTDKWLYGFGFGGDGAFSSSGNATFSTPNVSLSGTNNAGQKTLNIASASTFANGDLVLIHQSRGTGVGNWELNKIASGAGTTALTMVHNLCNTYADSGASQSQILKLKQYTSFTVNGGHTISAPAWDGDVGGIIAFLCNGATTISGILTASSKGYRGGQGGAQATNYTTYAYQGEGTGGAGIGRVQDYPNYANGNGGGGGLFSGDNVSSGAGGGGGGHATTGTKAPNNTQSSPTNATGGNGGDSVGNADGELTTVFFGGAGGGGGGDNNGVGATGGNGGGIVFIITKTLAQITGNIYTNGASGGDSNHNEIGCGGGGAGGSILIKAQEAILGTNKLTASGAIGGRNNPDGGDGSVGRIHLDYKTSYSGSTSPTLDVTQDTSLNYLAGAGILNSFL